MTISDYRDEIQLKLTGDILESELDEDTLNKIIKSALRELNRYYTNTELITIPYKTCIDLSDSRQTNNESVQVKDVVSIYRATGLEGNSSSQSWDPIQLAQWQISTGFGTMTNFDDAIYNYGAWATLGQLRNTLASDLLFRYEKSTHRLYVQTSSGTPAKITIEYIPIIQDVSDITSEYWQDILLRLALALTKITLGRIRTRYTQSNALWTQDGDTLLTEGNSEIEALREHLINSQLSVYPID